jgi:ABC-type glycerol-3-phosphate transport system permease component
MTALTRPTPVARRGRRFGRTTSQRIALIVGLALFTIWTLFPLIWIVETSIKPNSEIYSDATLIPRKITGVHYASLFQQTQFLTYFKNSLIVATLTTLVSMVIGVLGAYAITRLDFRGRVFVARTTIVTYLVPGSLLFIPLFQIAHQLNLTDKALGLVVIYLVGAVPFCTWLAISYFSVIPIELEQAALVDGANRVQALAYVTLPLALPALAVIALYAFTNAWNEFLFAFVFITSEQLKTLPVGLQLLVFGDIYPWGQLMSASLLMAIPVVIIYIFAQRYLVEGLTAGSVKG